jgi:hypothetical protein
VRGARDRRALRSGNSATETICDAVDVGHVLVAGHHQGRDLHLGKPLRCRGIQGQQPHVVVSVLLPEGLPLHLGDEVSHRRVHVVQIAVRAGEPQPQVDVDGGIHVAPFERRLFFGESRRHLLRPLVVGQSAPHEDQRRDSFRRLERELERRVAAHRDTDERGSIDAF